MALTEELLKGNAATAGLSEDQIKAVVEMSSNDENTVIAQKTSEIYSGLDADILSASGITKGTNEKTYDYAKRAIGEIKSQAGNTAELQKQVGELSREKSRLEKVIADGGIDAEAKRELAKAKADLQNVTKDYTELRTKYDQQKTDHEKAIFDMKIENELAGSVAGLKFKADLPESVVSVLKDQAIAKVKGMNPEYIDDGNGGKVLAFMQNGTPMRNKENNLRPYTAGELVQKELQAMGVLETGRKQTGAGTEESKPGTGKETNVDLSGARSQNEAQEILAKQLMSQGKVNGSKEFDDAMKAAWKDNWDIIKALPLN